MSLAEEIRKEEYVSLRAEILSAQQAETQFILAAMTAVGAFLGFATNYKAIYLCIPPLLLLAAIARNLRSRSYYVARLGQYIRFRHEEPLAPGGPNWESDLHRFRHLAAIVYPSTTQFHARTLSSLLRMLAWGCPLAAVFIVLLSALQSLTPSPAQPETTPLSLPADIGLALLTLAVFIWTMRSIGPPGRSWSLMSPSDLQALWRGADTLRRLAPLIGEDQASTLALEAVRSDRDARQLAHANLIGKPAKPNPAGGSFGSGPGGTLTAADLDKYLDPWSMTLPGGEGAAGG